MRIAIRETDKSKEREWTFNLEMSDATIIASSSVIAAAIAGVLICKVFSKK